MSVQGSQWIPASSAAAFAVFLPAYGQRQWATFFGDNLYRPRSFGGFEWSWAMPYLFLRLCTEVLLIPVQLQPVKGKDPH